MANSFRIQGTIPNEESDLGTPPKIFRSECDWSFTYNRPLRIPTEFCFKKDEPVSMEVVLHPKNDELLIETIATDAVRTGTKVQLQGVGALEAGKTYKVSLPNVLLFSTRVFQGKPVQLRLSSAVSSSAQKTNTDPNFLLDKEVFASIIRSDDGARALAQREDLPEVVFERLVSCPDPITRYYLLVNPNIPYSVLPWACGYPEVFRKNPACAFLFQNGLVQQHLSTFPKKKQDEIVQILFG
jgi:hypothetical protein